MNSLFIYPLQLVLMAGLSFNSLMPLALHSVRRVQYVMGTVCEIQAQGNGQAAVAQAVTLAFARISELDEALSTYKDTSEVSKINKTAHLSPVQVSPDTFNLLEKSNYFYNTTKGAFDVTLGQWENIELNADDKTVFFLKHGPQFDFGAIGKGLALDEAAQILKAHGVQKAMINFGGQVLLMGAGRIKSLSTSSQIEKPGHIKNPKSGKAVLNKGTVSVIAPTALEADVLSTAFFVMGEDKTKEFLKNNNRITVQFH